MAASRDQHAHTECLITEPPPPLPLTHTHSPHKIFVVSWPFAGRTLSPRVVGFGFFQHCRLALSAFSRQWFLWKQEWLKLVNKYTWAIFSEYKLIKQSTSQMLCLSAWNTHSEELCFAILRKFSPDFRHSEQPNYDVLMITTSISRLEFWAGK